MARGSSPLQGIAREMTVALQDAGQGLFATWRRLLAVLAETSRRVFAAVKASARAWLVRWEHAWEYQRQPADAFGAADGRVAEDASAIGLSAFLIGVVIAAWLIAASRHALVSAVAVIALEMLWAGARFILIAMLMPRGVIDRRTLTIAFLAGLTPYLVGATAGLRLLALTASALLTWRGLRGAGVSLPDTRRAIGWSFGGQLGVAAVGWLLRAAVALIASI